MLKQSLGLVSGAALMFMFAYGCSSTETTVNNATDAGTTTPTDGGKTDAKTPPPPSDGGGSDCKPGDVSSFTPAWETPPTFATTEECTPEQSAAFYDACVGDTYTQAACEKIMGGKTPTACGTCLLEKALTEEGRFRRGACLANVEGDLTDKSCGAKYDALYGCLAAACDDNCPGEDQASLDALDACYQAAAGGACKTFATAANSCVKALGAPAAPCLLQKVADVEGYVELWCGGPAGTTDGGTDAATDAPADAPADG